MKKFSLSNPFSLRRYVKYFFAINFRSIKYVFLLPCLLAYVSISRANGPSETMAWKSPMLDDGRRYLALMFTNDNEDDQYLDVIENAHSKGFNAFYLTVRMDAVKCHNQQCMIGANPNPSWNPANRSWTQTDAQIAKAKQLGMKIGIRIHLGNSDFGGNIRSTYLWGAGRLAEDQNGNTELGGWNFTKFTLSSQPAIDSAKKFVQEVLNRYGYLEGEGNLLFISFSNTSSQELEYDGSNLIDYSTASKNEYASWYLSNYGVPNPNVPTDFTSTEGKKWYKFRHCKLKDFVSQLSGVVRNHNSNIKIIHDVGSAFDVMSAKRGTLGFKSLAQHSDGFKVNDGFYYDHRFSMDILRGSLPGKMIMNEVFLANDQPAGYYASFANDVFTHGGKLLSLVTVNNSYLNQYAGDWSSITSSWISGSNGNMSTVNANGTVNYSFNEILNATFNGNTFSSGARNIYGEWQTQYNSNPSNGKPVNVVLDDNELSCNPTNPCDYNISASGPSGTVGTNTSITLSSTISGQSSGVSYSWSGTGITGSNTGSSVTFNTPSTAGTYTYTLTTSKSGCTNKTTTVQVTVGTPSGGGGCVVNKVKFQFRQTGECCMDRLQGAKIQGSNNGSTWIDLLTFTTNGTGSWQEFPISNTTAYSSVRFVASSTGWGELYELEFYNGSTKLSGTAFGTDNYANAFDGNITTQWHAPSTPGPNNYAGLNLTGCSTTTNCDFNVTASASPTSVNTNGSVTLTASCTGADCSGVTYAWSGNGASGSGSPLTITAPSTAGTYTYTLTASKSGCSNKTANTQPVTVTNPSSGSGCVVNKVKFQFRQTGECCMDRLQGAKIQGSNNGSTWTDLLTFTTNGTGSWQEFPISNTTAYSSVRFVASSTGWGELYELEFYNGSTKLTGTPFGIGNYANAFDGNLSTDWQVSSNPGSNNYAGLSNLGNCSGSPAMLEQDIDPSLANTKGIQVAPNPSQGVFYTSFYLERGKKATLVVSDMLGRTILRQQVTGQGLHKEKINLSNKASGTLLLQLIKDGRIEVKKFTVTR